MTPHRRRRARSLEELDLWLASDRAPAKSGWNVSAVDGFLAGIVVGPEPIKPKEWTRLIFGARPLGKDGDAAIQAVLDRHDAVAKALAEAPARYAPLFMRTDEGVVLAQDWAAGFLAAVRLRLTGGWSEKFEGGFGLDMGRHRRVLCNQGVDSFQSSEEAVRRVDHRVDLGEAVDPTVLGDHVVADLGQWRQAAAHLAGVVLAPSLEHVAPA